MAATEASKNFGSKIKEARQAFGLTQETMAVCFRVNSTTFTQWERGTLIPAGPNMRDLMTFISLSKNKEMLATVQNIRPKDNRHIVLCGVLSALIAVGRHGKIGSGVVRIPELVIGMSDTLNQIARATVDSILSENPSSQEAQ